MEDKGKDRVAGTQKTREKRQGEGPRLPHPHAAFSGRQHCLWRVALERAWDPGPSASPPPAATSQGPLAGSVLGAGQAETLS